MKMRPASEILSHCRVFAAAVLICLGAGSCFRGYDLSKIECDDKSQCPPDYECVRLSQQPHGMCTRGVTDGSSLADGIQPSDSPSSTNVDGSRDLATVGEAGPADARLDGTGGVAGASGGNMGAWDAAGTGGGTSGNVDAPLGTGGSPSGTGGGTGGNVDAPLGTGDSPPAVAVLVKGSPCTGNQQCPTTFCVDGVCCDQACTGCNACSAALTGGVDGTCASVGAGTDPHEECVDETAASPAKPCGNDGTCDGKGACRKAGAGQECSVASCSSDGTTFTPASTCDGNGTCAAGTAQVCTPYECATTGCKKTCSTQAQCDTGTYCETTAGICVAKKPNGKTSTQTFECVSGIIADGVCCDKDCTGCNACTATLNGQAASTTGTCMAVTAAKAADPHGVCPAASDPCGMDGTCNGAGACHYAAGGSDCGTPSCSSSMLTKSTCSSSHTCVAGTASACPGLLVCASTTACKTGACTSDSDCIIGNFCSGGTCTPKYDDSHSCTSGANNQCRNNNCVGGTCCSTPCGECHTCSTGTCALVSNGTACSTGVCNAGTCNPCTANQPCTVSGEECWNHSTSCSTGSSVCAKTTAVNNGTQCGSAARCNGSQSIGHWTCQGGTCTQPTPTSCPYTCNSSTGLCAGECSLGSSRCASTAEIQTCTSSYVYGTAVSCGANKQCTGNQCVCNAGTCGSSCAVCGGTTPYCSASGGCVACRTSGDCPSGYTTCSSAGVCGCRLQSSSNKIVNGGVDGGSYAPWALSGASFASAVDADSNCPGSGSLQFTSSASLYSNFSQCLPIGAGVSFRFGFRYTGAPICVLSYHSAAGCNSSTELYREDGYRNENSIAFWTDSTVKQGSTPSSTVSVKISCNPDSLVDPTTFDQFYFNTGGGGF